MKNASCTGEKRHGAGMEKEDIKIGQGMGLFEKRTTEWK